MKISFGLQTLATVLSVGILTISSAQAGNDELDLGRRGLETNHRPDRPQGHHTTNVVATSSSDRTHHSTSTRPQQQHYVSGGGGSSPASARTHTVVKSSSHAGAAPAAAYKVVVPAEIEEETIPMMTATEEDAAPTAVEAGDVSAASEGDGVEAAAAAVEDDVEAATVTEDGAEAATAAEDGAKTATAAEDGAKTATAAEDGAETAATAEDGAETTATAEDGAETTATAEDGAETATAAEDGAETATVAENTVASSRASRRPNNSDTTTTSSAGGSSPPEATAAVADTTKAEMASVKPKGPRPVPTSLVSKTAKLSPASSETDEEEADGESNEWWSNSPCSEDEFPIIIFLQTDGFAEDLGFVAFDQARPADEYVCLSDFNELEDETFYDGQICVKRDACYEFYFVDLFGNGFAAQGGLYVDVDGFNALDIRPGDVGTKVDTSDDTYGEQFWGFRFGRTCGFEDLEEPGYKREAPHDMDLSGGKSANGNCGDASSAVLFEMFYTPDSFSSTENSMSLIADDTYIWDYPIGAFAGLDLTESSSDYYFAICLDATLCNKFNFGDTFGDMNAESKLLVNINNSKRLELTPDEFGNITGDPDAMVTQKEWFLKIGTCGLGA